MNKKENMDGLYRTIDDTKSINSQGENNSKVTLKEDNEVVTIHTPYCRDCNICDNCSQLSAYRNMYSTLFNAATLAEEQIQNAGAILRKAQMKCEQIFVEADVTPLVFHSNSNEQ